jgi:secernin
MKWWKPGRDEFDFARVYGDHEHYSRQVSHIRWKRTSGLLEKNKGAIDASSMMRILRDHYEDTFLDGPQFHQFLPDFHTVCMHDSPDKFTWGNTATSLIVELEQNGTAAPRFFLAYLPPCTSIYIGFAWFDMLPEMLTRPGKAGFNVYEPKSAPQDTFDASSLWWRLHRIVEAVRENPKSRYQETFELFRPIEQRNIEKVSVLHNIGGTQTDWAQLIEEQLLQAISAIEELEKKWEIT